MDSHFWRLQFDFLSEKLQLLFNKKDVWKNKDSHAAAYSA